MPEPGDRLPRDVVLLRGRVTIKAPRGARRPAILIMDHIVFACDALADGTAWLTDQLGVGPAGGGKHPLMATHNSLWRLGSVYMEMIAIDPGAPHPGRRRWFGLDDPVVQQSLSKGPRLHHWVARTSSMAATLADARRSPGAVLRVTRDTLFWDLTVPEDGLLIHDGAYPTVICWPETVTPPNETLPDQGIGLGTFELFGPATFLEDLAQLGGAGIGAQSLAETAGFVATITRPDGKTLRFEH